MKANQNYPLKQGDCISWRLTQPHCQATDDISSYVHVGHPADESWDEGHETTWVRLKLCYTVAYPQITKFNMVSWKNAQTFRRSHLNNQEFKAIVRYHSIKSKHTGEYMSKMMEVWYTCFWLNFHNAPILVCKECKTSQQLPQWIMGWHGSTEEWWNMEEINKDLQVPSGKLT